MTNKLLNNIDTFGQWFVEFEKRNENCDGIAGIYNEKKQLETRLYPHARYDAVSILMDCLKELGVKDLVQHLGNIPIRPGPGIIKQIAAFIIYSISSTVRPAPRKAKMHTSGWPKQPLKVEKNRIAWRIFEKDQSNNISAIAKKTGGNINSYLIAGFIQHLSSIWVDKKQKISIGIPVSLYEKLTPGQPPCNRFAITDIQVDESVTSETIKQMINSNLASNKHYANWISYNLPKYLGAWVFKYFLLTTGHYQKRNMIFSNLGDWSRSLDNGIFLIPPVFHYNPISVAVLTWGGKLSIAIQVHPHLNIDSHKLEKIMDDWTNELSNEESVSYWASSRTINNLNIKNKEILI
ncbi:MAG: hypothetical protein ACKVHQ_15200 [Gammaproteobacteria bacterium]